MPNIAKTMPDVFENLIGCLVDKWAASFSDMNLQVLRVLVLLNVTACNLVKFMQQQTQSGLNKGKKKAPTFFQ